MAPQVKHIHHIYEGLSSAPQNPYTELGIMGKCSQWWWDGRQRQGRSQKLVSQSSWPTSDIPDQWKSLPLTKGGKCPRTNHPLDSAHVSCMCASEPTHAHMHTPTKLPAFKVYILFCYIIHSELISTLKLFGTPITSPSCVIRPHTYSLSTLHQWNSRIINKLGHFLCTSSHRTAVLLCHGPLE